MKAKFLLPVLFLFPFFSFAQENITITTYYPSPYGSYRELRVQRLALGENYSISSQYCWDGACTNYIDDDANPGTTTQVNCNGFNPGVSCPAGYSRALVAQIDGNSVYSCAKL